MTLGRKEQLQLQGGLPPIDNIMVIEQHSKFQVFGIRKHKYNCHLGKCSLRMEGFVGLHLLVNMSLRLSCNLLWEQADYYHEALNVDLCLGQ